MTGTELLNQKEAEHQLKANVKVAKRKQKAENSRSIATRFIFKSSYKLKYLKVN